MKKVSNKKLQRFVPIKTGSLECRPRDYIIIIVITEKFREIEQTCQVIAGKMYDAFRMILTKYSALCYFSVLISNVIDLSCPISNLHFPVVNWGTLFCNRY